MTRLLVSVRSLEEARLAATAGVDLIDLKEPRLGSLGCVGQDVARAIAGRLAPNHRLSMAFGELIAWTSDDFDACRSIPSGIEFAKIGLAGCVGVNDWPSRWRRAIQSLPPFCRPVAVAYADWRAAEAPDPQAIVTEASANGCCALLVDTCRKDRGDLFSHFSPLELRRLFDQATSAGLLTVLAGSLSLRTIETAFDLDPDYVAVRGAVCDGARDGQLCATKLRQWRTIVSDDLQRAARRPDLS